MEQTDAMIAKQVTHTAINTMKRCRERNCNSLEQEWTLKRLEQTAAKHTHKARWKMEQGELHSLRPDMHCSCLLTNAAAEDAPVLIFEKIQKFRYLEQARKKKRTRDWITSYDVNFV